MGRKYGAQESMRLEAETCAGRVRLCLHLRLGHCLGGVAFSHYKTVEVNLTAAVKAYPNGLMIDMTGAVVKRCP